MEVENEQTDIINTTTGKKLKESTVKKQKILYSPFVQVSMNIFYCTF